MQMPRDKCARTWWPKQLAETTSEQNIACTWQIEQTNDLLLATINICQQMFLTSLLCSAQVEAHSITSLMYSRAAKLCQAHVRLTSHISPMLACRFIDQTLQLSNLPALSGYLFGGSSTSNVLGRWDGDVVAGTFDELAKQVRHLGFYCQLQRFSTWFVLRIRTRHKAPELITRPDFSSVSSIALACTGGQGQNIFIITLLQVVWLTSTQAMTC